ncbi:MAG: hypothetical protein IPG43_06220 [Proteobacteria bacterium]|nr:hypothetical protein [Pseudomonadota bacterium]
MDQRRGAVDRRRRWLVTLVRMLLPQIGEQRTAVETWQIADIVRRRPV